MPLGQSQVLHTCKFQLEQFYGNYRTIVGFDHLEDVENVQLHSTSIWKDECPIG
jgi:hypothetical protein